MLNSHSRSIALREPTERVLDNNEIYADKVPERTVLQIASSCQDCGIPFCCAGRFSGCCLDSRVPEWLSLAGRGMWRPAFKLLESQNPFPEFTSRICDAPCETACVLGINESPVSIREVEKAIVDKAFENGWVDSEPRNHRNGRRVAVIGSGPSGLAVANHLNDHGCDVVVFERADRVGGLLMYGIPNERLEKRIVQRRAGILASKGVKFCLNAFIGYNVDPRSIMAEFHAVVLCVGSTIPRDLEIPGRQLRGVHFAMEFLTANTKSLLDSNHADGNYISAKGKSVVVMGLADGWSGSILRHEPHSITCCELLPEHRDELSIQWPNRGTSHYAYGHEEYVACRGIDPRRFSYLAEEFVDDGNGDVCGVRIARVAWRNKAGRFSMEKVPSSEEVIPSQLVLIASGFLGPESTLSDMLNLERDPRSNFNRITNVPGLFSAGDCRTGQSNIIKSIKDGLEVADLVYRYLCG